MLRKLCFFVYCMAVWGSILEEPSYYISNSTISYYQLIKQCLSEKMVPANTLDFLSGEKLEKQIKNQFNDGTESFWIASYQVRRPNDILYLEKLQDLKPTQCEKFSHGPTGFYWNMADCNSKLRYICKSIPESAKPTLFDRIKQDWKNLPVDNWENNEKLIKQKPYGKKITYIDLDGSRLKIFVSAEHDRLNFTDALNSCAQTKMEPLYILDQTDNQNLLNIISKVVTKENKINDSFWTGGVRSTNDSEKESSEVDEEKDIMWLPSTRSFIFYYWHDFPNSKKKCVLINYHISGSGWEADYCNQTFRYLCREKHASSPLSRRLPMQ